MERRDTRSGGKLQNILVRSNELNYREMSVVTQIYISYVVISIILINFMIDIELVYLTLLHQFLGCCFDYLPLFTPVGLTYFLDKV